MPTRPITPQFQQITVTIDEIDVATRTVHAHDKTNATIQASFREAPGATLRIPSQGELWTCQRIGFQWHLNQRIDTVDELAYTNDSMSPGDARLAAAGTLHVLGEGISFNGQPIGATTYSVFTADGTNTVFTLGIEPVHPHSVQVFENGLLIDPRAFTVVGANVNFFTPPAAGTLIIYYQRSGFVYEDTAVATGKAVLRALTLNQNTQSGLARIQNAGAKTQGAIARIQATATKTQTGVANIILAPRTSILSSFTGADENPLSEGGVWSSTPILTSSASLFERLSNQAAANGASARQPYNTTFANDQEAFVTLATPTSAGSGVYCRIQNEGTASANGYAGQYHTGVGWRIFRVAAGAATQIGSTDATVAAAGDGLWLSCIGTTITLYHFTGGQWHVRVQVTDSVVAGGGKIGMVCGDTTGRLDDFGGGAA